MAIIRTLKSFLGKSIYPKTVTKAIYDGNNRLDQMITNGLSNPNILINGNFSHPVNQRGETVLTGSATDARYTIDRWALLGENAVFNVFDNYITLRKPKASLFAELYQLLEFPATYNNRPLTLTVSFKGTAGGMVSLRGFGDNNSFVRKDIRCTGNVQTESITFTPKGVSDYLRGADIILAEYNGKEYLPTSKDYELTLYWAKLEDGEYSTPFRPRLYAEELQLCQRYYQWIHGIRTLNPFYTENILQCSFHWLSIMRCKPTAIIDNSRFEVIKQVKDSSVVVNGFTISKVSTYDNGVITVELTKTNHGITTGLINMFGGIALDAEL